MARPQTLIQRWPQADEKVVAASPLPIDDGSEAWWSGAQLCFVQLAIAGAAATLANTAAIAGTFNFNDERPTPASALQVDEVYEWDPPIIQGIPQPKVWAEDERIAPTNFVPVDDDPQVQILSTASANFIVWVTDDGFAPQSVPVALDDGTWQLPATAPASPYARVWVEADDFATNFALPEDDWQQPAPRLPGPFTQTWVDEAIAFAAPTLTVDESYWQQPLLAQPRPSIAQQFDDDLAVPQPTPLSEEDYWLRLYSVAVDPVVQLWTQQDEAPTAATPLQIDEVYWQQPVIQAVPPAQQAMAADDEVIPQPPQNEDYWQRPVWMPVDPLAVIWTHQDEIARIGVDEAYWQQPYSVTVPPAQPAYTADAEIVPPAAPLTIDEVYWRAPFLYVTVAPVAVVFLQQDEVPAAAAPAVFTADSRERVGLKSERAAPQRIGNSTGWAVSQRIGTKRQ